MEGQFLVRTGAGVIDARPSGSQVRLLLDHGAGFPGSQRRQQAQYDHLIEGTDYGQDVNRLRYVSSDVRREVFVAAGAPVLSRWFESTVPGPYVVVSSAVGSPEPRPKHAFLSGTRFTAPRPTRHLGTRGGWPRPDHEAPGSVDLSAPAVAL